MVKKFTKDEFLAVVDRHATPPNCDLTLQIKAIYAKDGLAKGIWNIDEKFLNGNGVVMGGFLASAADIMMAYAIASRLKEKQTFATIDLHTTFHRPVFPGQVEVLAKVERLGNRTAYVTAQLWQNDKKAADVVSSLMILEE